MGRPPEGRLQGWPWNSSLLARALKGLRIRLLFQEYKRPGEKPASVVESGLRVALSRKSLHNLPVCRKTFSTHVIPLRQPTERNLALKRQAASASRVAKTVRRLTDLRLLSRNYILIILICVISTVHLSYRRAATNQYRSVRKGRRSVDIAVEYVTMTKIAIEGTRTAESAVRANL